MGAASPGTVAPALVSQRLSDAAFYSGVAANAAHLANTNRKAAQQAAEQINALNIPPPRHRHEILSLPIENRRGNVISNTRQQQM